MAARNPTTWTELLDPKEFQPRAKLVETEPDKLFDDQVFVLDAPQLLVADCFTLRTTSSTSYVDLLGKYYFLGKNLCATGSASVGCYIAVYCWATDSTTDFTIRVTNSVPQSYFAAVTAGADAATKKWRAISGSLEFTSDGVEDNLTVSFKCDGTPTGSVCIGGILVVANET